MNTISHPDSDRLAQAFKVSKAAVDAALDASQHAVNAAEASIQRRIADVETYRHLYEGNWDSRWPGQGDVEAYKAKKGLGRGMWDDRDNPPPNPMVIPPLPKKKDTPAPVPEPPARKPGEMPIVKIVDLGD